jgi:hypothetical protein
VRGGPPDAITTHRLNAVLGIEYQRAVGAFSSAHQARETISSFYGVEPDAMRKWSDRLKRSIGEERFAEEMEAASFCGLLIRHSKARGWSLANGFEEGVEATFGLDALRASGRSFQEQRSKSDD